MGDLADLIARRGVIKGQMSKFKTFLDGFDVSKNNQLDSRMRKCEEWWSEFQNVQFEIEKIDNTGFQENERDLFENHYFELISRASDLLKAGSNSVANSQCINTASSGSLQGGRQVNTDMPLPPIDIPKFSGSYRDWPQFKDAFETIVEANKQLSTYQKFYYLKNAVVGDAANLINSMTTKESDYMDAWELLKEQYDNEKYICYGYLDALMDLPVMIKESHTQLSKFLNEIRKCSRSIKNLGQPIDQWDTLLIFMLEKKLDYATKRAWKNEIKVDQFPTMKQFLDFLVRRCKLIEPEPDLGPKNYSKQVSVEGKGKNDKRYVSVSKTLFTSSSHASDRNRVCIICKGNSHPIYLCTEFLSATLSERRNKVRSNNLCWNCLKQGHQAQNCLSRGCKKCNQKHNSLLHNNDGTNSSSQGKGGKINSESGLGIEAQNSLVVSRNENENRETEHSTVMVARGHRTSEVLLSTAVVQVEDVDGQLHYCRALLDSGSQSSFISRELCDKLQLPLKKIDMTILGIGQGAVEIKQLVNINIKSTKSDFAVRHPFLIINRISGRIPSYSINIEHLNIPKNIQLADSCFAESGKIDMLLGSSIFWDLICGERMKLGAGKPILHSTKLGWVVAGQTEGLLWPDCQSKQKPVEVCNLVSNTSVQEQLEKFWILEDCPMEQVLTKDEQRCEEIFQNTTERAKDGKFIVTLPMKSNRAKLGNSYDIAVKRFLQLERKLYKNSDLQKHYHDFMREYINLGHMEKTKNSELKGIDGEGNQIYYLPHHAVFKDTSVTTKCRVVFDASAPADNGVSLNDTLLVGPKLQKLLFEILLKYRQHRVALVADIAKMYRMVWINKRNQDLQRILWRFSSDDPIEEYTLLTVTYGTAPASFLAVRCLHELALQAKDDFPEASRAILEDFYMDDFQSGAETIEQAKQLKHEVSQILSSGGFILRKWMSNERETISDELDMPVIDHYISDEGSEHKTLGLFWNSEKDYLHFSVKNDTEKTLQHRITKRLILSSVAQLFDPLGIIGPIVIRAKILLQCLWKHKLDWDEQVPIEVGMQWNRLRDHLGDLVAIRIPRRVICDNCINTQLHCFSDASEAAYGACIYIRSTDHNGKHHVELLCAKSRVAPIKVVTLPRLELCAALVAARLFSVVRGNMNTIPDRVFFWSDSKIVLAWLAAEPTQWKTFVSNRVSEIQEITQGGVWRHIKSEKNPADIISRGMEPSLLKACRLWWHGPTFLLENEDCWVHGEEENEFLDVPEGRIVKQSFISIPKSFDLLNKYSSFIKLQRVVAYCLRFCHNTTRLKDERSLGPLSVAELQESLLVLIKTVQGHELYREIGDLKNGQMVSKKSKIVSLYPFIDENGLLRVGGRLRNSEVEYDQKHPIILPKCDFTKNLIRHEHYKNLHAGPQALLGIIRLRFWPVTGRNYVKAVLRKCMVCFRIKPPDTKQIMGDLPKQRVIPSRPFTNCGIDYGGPFEIKASKVRNNKTVKAYLCAFVCFSTRAVHLEVVGDLSTDAFLNAFKRFTARRGLCANIYSDNGTNFVGARNELRELLHFMKDPKNLSTFADHFAKFNIQWHFIPPRSPHFGGNWESVIKAAKYHMKRVIGNQKLTFEELTTVVTQIEGAINSRPLTPLTEDPDDMTILTPSHFLIGTSLSAVPQVDVKELKQSRLSRFQLLTQLLQGFWHHWSHNYLNQLQQRNKWRTEHEPISVGSMVLLKEDNLPPLQWRMGRVMQLHLGHDNLCRVVSVQTAKGVVKRAIAKVVFLPIDKDNTKDSN